MAGRPTPDRPEAGSRPRPTGVRTWAVPASTCRTVAPAWTPTPRIAPAACPFDTRPPRTRGTARLPFPGTTWPWPPRTPAYLARAPRPATWLLRLPARSRARAEAESPVTSNVVGHVASLADLAGGEPEDAATLAPTGARTLGGASASGPDHQPPRGRNSSGSAQPNRARPAREGPDAALPPHPPGQQPRPAAPALRRSPRAIAPAGTLDFRPTRGQLAVGTVLTLRADVQGRADTECPQANPAFPQRSHLLTSYAERRQDLLASETLPRTKLNQSHSLSDPAQANRENGDDRCGSC